MYHHIVDENGEAPMVSLVYFLIHNVSKPSVCQYYLPWQTVAGGYQFWSNATDSNLAEYLQYYKIGLDLVEQGNAPTIKPDSRDQVLKVLGRYTYSRAL